MADRTSRPPTARPPPMSSPRGTWSRLAFGAAVALLVATQAHAEERGIVVRLRAPGEDPAATVTVRLTPPDAEPVDTTLGNDGVSPDVARGDDTWAGGTTIDGSTVTAAVTVGGRVYTGEAATWGAADDARELLLVLDGGTLTATATVAGVSRAGAAGGPRSPGGDDTSGLALGAGLAVGVCGLLALGFAWVRAGRPTETGAPLRIVGVATLAGPALPGEAASDGAPGLATWVAADPDAALHPVLSLLAARHRVLVVVPTPRAIPPVMGGPVYTLAETDPFRVADDVAVFARHGSRPLAVVVLGGTAATWVPLVESLPPGARAVLLVGDSNVPPITTDDTLATGTARVERDGAGWVVRDAATVVPLGEGPRRAARATG